MVIDGAASTCEAQEVGMPRLELLVIPHNGLAGNINQMRLL